MYLQYIYIKLYEFVKLLFIYEVFYAPTLKKIEGACCFCFVHLFVMPPPFSMGSGGEYCNIVSPLSVCMSVHLSVLSLPTKNGFPSISFEKVCVLDLYFIQRHIIIEYRSNLI